MTEVDNTKFIDRVAEFKALNDKDLTNDYYFIQYLGTILDFIEREHTGCLTELGRMSLAVNVAPIYQKFVEGKEKVTQKELVKFCLYMTNAYAVCVLFKGMVELFKEKPVEFMELNPLPSLIFDDMKKFEDRAFDLVDKFKKIMDAYCNSLEGKYRTIYNEEKHKGFVKQIFSVQVINQSLFKPTEIEKAVEMK